jgi:SAM-dependent methyltransferase
MRRYGERRRRNAILKWKHSGKLLDVGSATGVFLASMNRPGWDVSGIELNAEAAAYAARRLGIRTVAADILSADLLPRTYDVITLWDVLEHLAQPERVIAKLAGLCKPGALLVVQVPRLGSWQQRLFGPSWIGWDVPRHLVLFTQRQLRDLLERAGFEFLEARSLAGDYPTFLISLKTAAQDTGSLWLRALVNIVSTLPARLLLFLAFALIRSLGGGTSLTILAKRKDKESTLSA